MRENAAQKQFLLAETFNEAAESPSSDNVFLKAPFLKLF